MCFDDWFWHNAQPYNSGTDTPGLYVYKMDMYDGRDQNYGQAISGPAYDVNSQNDCYIASARQRVLGGQSHSYRQ